MAGVDIGRKRWPGHPHAGVDESHPLAHGLVTLYGKLFGAKRGRVTADFTAATVNGSFGVSAEVGTGVIITAATGTGSAAPPVTFGAVFRFISSSGEMHLLTNDNGASVNGTSFANRCWQFRCTTGTLQFLAFDTGGGSLPINFTLAITSGVPYAAIVSVSADRDAEMRLINLSTSEITVVSSTASSTGNWAGADSDTAAAGQRLTTEGRVSAVYRWNRNLTSQEMDMFLADPFCMLRV